MTVKEYNEEFLPKIDAAECVVENLELAINHVEISDEAKAEVLRHLRIHACWSEESKQLILDALEYYKEHEGIDKLELPNTPKEGSEITLHDLTTGMIVTTRNGEEWTVFRNYSCTMKHTAEKSTDGVLVSNNDKDAWIPFSEYKGDMTIKSEDGSTSDFDIIQVEIPSHPCSMLSHNYLRNDRKLFWERELVKEVTMEEVEAMFGCKVKFIRK